MIDVDTAHEIDDALQDFPEPWQPDNFKANGLADANGGTIAWGFSEPLRDRVIAAVNAVAGVPQLILADQPTGWLRHILRWTLAMILATREKHVESTHGDTWRNFDPDCETCRRFSTISLWLRLLDDAEGEQTELDATEVAGESMAAFFNGLSEGSEDATPIVVTMSAHTAVDLRRALHWRIRDIQHTIAKISREWNRDLVPETLPTELRRLQRLYEQIAETVEGA